MRRVLFWVLVQAREWALALTFVTARDENPRVNIKPIWIPLLGWVLLASGFYHLGVLLADWGLGHTTLELGFLTIPLGIALIQGHRFSVRLLAVFCFFAAALLGLFFFLPEGAAWPKALAMVSILAFLVLGILLFRSENKLPQNHPSFNPRRIPRQIHGPVTALFLMAGVGVFGYYQVERQNLLFEEVQEFQLRVIPFDPETEGSPEGGLLYRLDSVESPGFARQQGFSMDSGGAWFHFLGNAPLTVKVRLYGAQHPDPTSATILFPEGMTEKTVRVPMRSNANSQP